MEPKWELNLGVVRGLNYPKDYCGGKSVEKALSDQCIGPYNEAGTNLGLALYIEGDDLQLGRGGVKVEPFRNNYIGAQIYFVRLTGISGALAGPRFPVATGRDSNQCLRGDIEEETYRTRPESIAARS